MTVAGFLFDRRVAAGRLARRGDRARDRGAYDAAAALYLRALARDHRRGDIRVQLGHMLKELGRYPEAEAAYRQALARMPDDGDAHLQLGHLLKLTGRRQEAVACYRQARLLLPDDDSVAAELRALGGEPDGVDPGAASTHEGDRLRDAGRPDEAAEAYRVALAAAPDRADIRLQYGNMLKDSGRLQEAEAAYRTVLAQAPAEAEAHLQLGHVLKLQGRRGVALEAYARAAELAPLLPAPHQELFLAGHRPSQDYLFEAQLRLGGVVALTAMTHQLVELRGAVTRLLDALPDIAAQTAFPLSAYDRFRRLYGVPPPPPAARPHRVAILLPADRERSEVFHAQLAAMRDQTHAQWTLIVIGRDPARRQVVERAMLTEPRMLWVEAADTEEPAVAERRAALARDEDLLLFLAEGALIDRRAVEWFAAVVGCGAAVAFVADEETVTHAHGQVRHSAPIFRQVVDYDTLLELNPFGETLSIERAAYASIAASLATGSIAAARASLLLSLARDRRVGHVPAMLVARDGAVAADPAQEAAAHAEAVQAHIAAAGLGGRIVAERRPDPPLPDLRPRLAIDWIAPQPDGAIAVIIPTRDNGADLRRCVDSLRATASRPGALSLIVVDNGSRQAETRRILDDIAAEPGARVIAADEPFNWSRLNNRAAAAAEAPLLVFANDDMIMLSDGWDARLRGLLSRPEIGAVGTRLLYPDDTVQHAGMLFGWRGTTIHDGLYETRLEPGPTSRWHVTRAVSAVTGAFLATRHDVFVARGGFDATGLPVSYGDVDYALKLRAAGLKILWTPDITLHHFESKTRGFDHLDAERHARNAAERAVLDARWGAAIAADPSVNPVWHMATLPFRLLAAPSQARLSAHIARCAADDPWLPKADAPAGASSR